MLKTSAGNFTKEELRHWLNNALLFTLPADLAFLIVLQGAVSQGRLIPNQQDLIFAFGAFYSAIISALIGLIRTYITNNNPK